MSDSLFPAPLPGAAPRAVSFRGWLAVLAAVMLICSSARAWGQPKNETPQDLPKTSAQLEQEFSAYEGQNVTSIVLAGRPNLDIAEYTPLFAQKPGEPLSLSKIQQTIDAVQQKGRFQEVRLMMEPQADGLEVLLVLEPAVYFGVFTFTGSGWFPYSRLLQVTNYPPETAYNSEDIRRAVENLLTFCRQEGFFEAKIVPETELLPREGVANIVFHMDLGRHSKFGEITIDGVPPEQAARLKGSLRSIWARLTGAAIRPGRPYRHSTVTKATRLLEGKLTGKNRLAATVRFRGAQYHEESNRADVTFDARRGPIIHVKIQGAHLWSWTKKSLLPVYQGAGMNRELVQEGAVALTSYFQGKGYFGAKVDSRFEKQGDTYNLVYKITKGKKHKVTSVKLSGNHILKSDQLRPLLKVQQAHLFSRGKYSQKLVDSSTKNLKDFYLASGFRDASVKSDVQDSGGNVRVTFTVDEGPRDTVHSLEIQGAKTLARSEYAPKGLKLTVGGPYSQNLIQQDRRDILANYLNAGYPNVAFQEKANPVAKQDPHQINVLYQIDEGPRVTIRNLYTLGNRKTQPRVIAMDTAALKPGTKLSEAELLSSESRLYDNPGVFDWAEIDPRRRITTQTSEDVLVKVHEAPKNQITYGLGFEFINRGGNVPSGTIALPNLPPVGLPSQFKTNQQTFWGPRGTMEYTRNNVRGRGESISLTVFAGRLHQRGAAFYIDPHLFWSSWRSTASISADHDAENPIFSSNQESAGYQVQKPMDKEKTKTLFFRYTFSHTDLTRLEIPELVPPDDRNVKLSTLSTAFIRDTRDNILNAHRGMLESVNLDFNATELGADVDFAKLTGQAAYYKEIGDGIVWANSLRIGLAPPFAGSHVPLSELFFTGGGSTLRGFPLDSAGPQRKVQVCSEGSTTDCSLIQVPTGGKELMLINSEFRIPLPIMSNLGMAMFYDGGNVFPGVGFSQFQSLYSNNVGLGLRYETPVGPIRLDVGRNLSPVPGINPTQFFISIGQAF